MKHLIVAGMLAAGVICAPMAFADESGTASDTSHHFVKDSVITTKVKSKLAAKHLTTLTRIKVDTDEDGVVWLSGRAPTQDAVDMATMIAKDTDGGRFRPQRNRDPTVTRVRSRSNADVSRISRRPQAPESGLRHRPLARCCQRICSTNRPASSPRHSLSACATAA